MFARWLPDLIRLSSCGYAAGGASASKLIPKEGEPVAISW